jgi:hypothetical protein
MDIDQIQVGLTVGRVISNYVWWAPPTCLGVASGLLRPAHRPILPVGRVAEAWAGLAALRPPWAEVPVCIGTP